MGQSGLSFVWARFKPQAPVVQKLDSAVHLYPVDKYWGNQLHYSVDGDLSGG